MSVFKRLPFCFIFFISELMAADIVLEHKISGSLVGINAEHRLAAITNKSELCLYSADASVAQQCFSLPNPQTRATRAKWSKSGTQLSFVLLNANTGSQVIWKIDLASNARSLIWPLEKVTGLPFKDNIVIYEWLNDKELVVGYPCGNECAWFNIVGTDKKVKAGGHNLISAGNRRWQKTRNQLIAKGHAGSLISLSIRDSAPFFQQTQHFDDCLEESHWFWYLDSVSPDEWLLSRQNCNRGSPLKMGSWLYIYKPVSNKLVKMWPGALAAPDPKKNLIAILEHANNKAVLNVVSRTSRKSVARFPIDDYLLEDSDIDSFYNRARPQWSPDSNYILIPKIINERRQIRLQAYIASLSNLGVQRLELPSQYAENFYFLGEDILVVSADDAVYFYRIAG